MKRKFHSCNNTKTCNTYHKLLNLGHDICDLIGFFICDQNDKKTIMSTNLCNVLLNVLKVRPTRFYLVFLEYYRKRDKPYEFLQVLKNNSMMDIFLRNKYISHSERNRYTYWAFERGYLLVVKELLRDPSFDPSENNQYLINLAF